MDINEVDTPIKVTTDDEKFMTEDDYSPPKVLSASVREDLI